MKRIIYILPVLLSLGLAACTKKVVAPCDEPMEPSADNSSFFEGEIYVKFTPQFTQEIEDGLADGNTKAISSLEQAVQVQSMERLFPYAGEYEPRTRKEGLHQWYIVRLDSETNMTKASFDLADLEFVEVAEPVRKARVEEYDDAYYYKYQWNMSNRGDRDRYVAGMDINVEPVWDGICTGDPSVIVSIVDEGVDKNHEDLKFNYVGGYNFVTNKSTVTAGNHGSHVAGVIAATNSNGKGVRGIAGGDFAADKRGVGLLSCQVFNDSGSGNFPNAIKYGADHGAVISQNSWGYDFSEEKNPYEAAKRAHAAASLRDAINYFIKYAGCDNNGNQLPGSPMKGGVVIFAAGNDGWDVNCICEECNVVAVGAIGPAGEKTKYSNYGEWVDICAPGGEMSWGNYCGILSTVPGGYAYMQGTSMACPHVSGVAALIISKFGGQGYTREMLLDKLLNGANPRKPDSQDPIGPLVDAYGSFIYGQKTPPSAVNDFEVTEVKSNMARFEFSSVGDADGLPALFYHILVSRNKADVESPDMQNLPESVQVFKIPGPDEVGARLSFLAEIEGFDKRFYSTVVASSYGEVYSKASNMVDFTTGFNHAPEIVSDHKGDYVIRKNQTFYATFMITDPDGHSVTSKVEGENAALKFSSVTGGYQMRVVGTDAEPGKYEAAIHAQDKYGMATSLRINYEILENQAPQIIAPIPNKIIKTLKEKAAISLDQYISDPDGDELTYKIKTSISNVVSVDCTGNLLLFTSTGYGLCTLEVTASDYSGKSCTASFKVLVQDDPVGVTCNEGVALITLNEEEPVAGKVSVVSQTGKEMFVHECTLGAFEPVEVPVKTWVPGYYTATVVYRGKSVSSKFLKL